MSMKFQKMRASRDRKTMGETNDCTVIAVALTCRVTYKRAHKAMWAQGRKPGRGAYSDQYLDAVQTLGFRADKVTNRGGNPLRQPNGSKYTPKTIGNRLKRGYYLVQVSGHCLTVINGEVQDWTDGRNHHIKHAWKITRPK